MQYIDVITYCPDITVLAEELAEKLPAYVIVDHFGDTVLLVDKTPTIKNGKESLSLVRLTPDQLATLESAELATLQVLGTFDEVFADPEKKEIYDRVYVRAIETTDHEGNPVTRVLPERFGAFA